MWLSSAWKVTSTWWIWQCHQTNHSGNLCALGLKDGSEPPTQQSTLWCWKNMRERVHFVLYQLRTSQLQKPPWLQRICQQKVHFSLTVLGHTSQSSKLLKVTCQWNGAVKDTGEPVSNYLLLDQFGLVNNCSIFPFACKESPLFALDSCITLLPPSDQMNCLNTAAS